MATKLQKIKNLFHSVERQIEKVRIFLNKDSIQDKTLKQKISLLSSLLEVKKKVRSEWKELLPDSEKTPDSLREFLGKK